MPHLPLAPHPLDERIDAWSLRRRCRHAVNGTSSFRANVLTSLALTLVPQRTSMTAVTFRVETPWKYISAIANTSACSLRS
jgi:hypothetical protein